jgi:signal transduction histidine kinase
MTRMVAGSVAYLDFLLGKVHRAHQEERRRMARELHDRLAHAIGVALHHMELYRAYADRTPEAAADELEQASRVTREALKITAQLSGELRESADGGLCAALAAYVTTNAPPGIRVTWACTGDDTVVPAEISEELYVVLREAVRNALVHSGTPELRVRLDFSTAGVRAAVCDTGHGFDVERVLRERTCSGLTSMRERIELVGGVLTLTSLCGAGTTVDVRVSLARSST